MTSLAEYNLFDPQHVECPYPFYEALHGEAPVYEVPGLGIFLVSRYAQIVDVLRDPDTFSNDFSAAGNGALFGAVETDEILEIRAGGYEQVNTMLTCDPPAHSRYRALVATAFTPRKVAAMRPAIQRVADELVDEFVEDGEVELVGQFAVGLPLTVVADALGVSREDMPRFKRWSDDSVAPLGAILPYERQVEVARSIVEFQHYFAERIEERRAEPRDDLLTDLVQASVDGEEPLTTPEVLSIVQQILVAGNETTTKLIGSGTLLLLQHPDVMARVVADLSLVPQVVEEALRLETPLQGMFRVAKADVELDGVKVPAGSLMLLMYGAGNRDEEQFAEAARFELTRANARVNLAFGQGIHYCIGAALARAEAAVAFETLLRRLDNLHLPDGRNDFLHEPSFLLRGLRALHIEFQKGERVLAGET